MFTPGSEAKGAFHIHSNYSFDSLLKPKTIVNYAIRHNFDILSIADHNTIAGSVEASRYNPSSRLHVIIGAEYSTDKGDIIGLFLNSEIKSKESVEVINEIKNQGGIAVLPHPFKEHHLDCKLVKSMDLIEIYNGRVQAQANRDAEKLARKYNKQIIVGSDAHFLSEIQLAEMFFKVRRSEECLKSLVLEADRRTKCKESSIREYYELTSQLIKSRKNRDFKLFTSLMKQLALKLWL